MAQVSRRVPLVQARADAEAFMAAVEPWCERIAIAGSVRRGVRDVGDVEYVVIPKVETLPGPGLFGGTVERNVLWSELDAVVESGKPLMTPGRLNEIDAEGLSPSIESMPGAWTIGKALRGDPLRTCWGERQRAVWFRGMTHELYLADADNWGSMMVIRTGPAAFSRHVVTELRRCGLKHEGGRVVNCQSATQPRIPTPDEETLFRLIGLTYREPKDRVGLD